MTTKNLSNRVFKTCVGILYQKTLWPSQHSLLVVDTSHSEQLLVSHYPGSSSSGLSQAVFSTCKALPDPLPTFLFNPQVSHSAKGHFLKKDFPVFVTKTNFPVSEIPAYLSFVCLTLWQFYISFAFLCLIHVLPNRLAVPGRQVGFCSPQHLA